MIATIIFEEDCKNADGCARKDTCAFKHPSDEVEKIRKFCFKCPSHTADPVPAECNYVHIGQTCGHGTPYGEFCIYQSFYNLKHKKYAYLKNPAPARRMALQKYMESYVRKSTGDDINLKTLRAKFGIPAPPSGAEKPGPGEKFGSPPISGILSSIGGIPKGAHVQVKVGEKDYSVPKRSEMDLVICIDSTGSMASWIKQSVKLLVQVVEQFKAKCCKPPRFAIVDYKDHDSSSTYVVRRHGFGSAEDAIAYLNSLKADGGGDGHEAVFDGLKETLSLDWRPQADCTKILLHVADAPPHGAAFGSHGDDHKTGCPCGIKLEEITALIKSKHVLYHLIKIGGALDETEKVFKERIPHCKVKPLNDLEKFVPKLAKMIIKRVCVTMSVAYGPGKVPTKTG